MTNRCLITILILKFITLDIQISKDENEYIHQYILRKHKYLQKFIILEQLEKMLWSIITLERNLCMILFIESCLSKCLNNFII